MPPLVSTPAALIAPITAADLIRVLDEAGIERHLCFDVSGTATASPARQAALVERIRQIGLHRILYGSDAPTSGNSPSEAWAAFRSLPLTDEEFRTIEQNLAPYMR